MVIFQMSEKRGFVHFLYNPMLVFICYMIDIYVRRVKRKIHGVFEILKNRIFDGFLPIFVFLETLLIMKSLFP